MSEIMTVLMLLASLAFLLEVVLERIKCIFPFIKGTYTFNIGKTKFEISPMHYISLICALILMFAINQPISLFGSLGFAIPLYLDNIVNAFIISGGSNIVHDIANKWKKKEQINTEDSME